MSGIQALLSRAARDGAPTNVLQQAEAAFWLASEAGDMPSSAFGAVLVNHGFVQWQAVADLGIRLLPGGR